MTTAVNDRSINYTGDGSTKAFSFDFPISATSEVEVSEVSVAGVVSVKTLTTDYTVSISGDGTGSVTYVTAPASGVKVILTGKTPASQAASYSESDAFPATAHEASMDKLARVLQEVKRDIGRAPKVPPGETATVFAAAAARAGYIARFNASTGQLEASDLVDSIVADLVALENADLENIAWLVDQLQSGGFDTLVELGVTDAAVHLTYAEARALSLAQAAKVGQVTVIDRGEPIPCVWVSGDQSAGVTGDEITTGEGDGILWFAPTADKTGASGAFKALVGNVVTPLMYGATGDGVEEDGDAVLAAAASSRDVDIPGGYTFLMNGKTIQPVSGQRFSCAGRLRKSDLTNDLTPAGGSDGPKFFHINGVDDVEIDGLVIEYTGSLTGSEKIYGVTVESAERIKVVNNNFLGPVTPCRIWRLTDDVTYTGNTSEGGRYMVATGGDGASASTAGLVNNIKIRNNTCKGVISEGIDVNMDTHNCWIENNVFTDFDATTGDTDCIDVGGGTCRNICIRGNTIDGNQEREVGIYIKLDTRNCWIENNTISNMSEAAASRGIFVATGDPSSIDEPENVHISGNDVSGVNQPIYVYSGCKTVFIEDNYVHDLQGNASGFGIRVENASPLAGSALNRDITIKGNVLDGTDCVGNGIYMDDADGFTIAENKIRNFPIDAVVATSTTLNGRIIDNDILENDDDGIVATSPGLIIEGNRIEGNGKTAINTSGDGCIVKGNRIVDNSVTTDAANLILGGDNLIVVGNLMYDTRGTAKQSGLRAPAGGDGWLIDANNFHSNKTYDYKSADLALLTNSTVVTNHGVVA